MNLGTPVVPFCQKGTTGVPRFIRPFYFVVSLLKLNSRKEGTLIVHGLLGYLGMKKSALG